MIQKKNLTVAEKLLIHKKAREAAQKLVEKGLSAFVAKARTQN